jgi:hypothetical protein
VGVGVFAQHQENPDSGTGEVIQPFSFGGREHAESRASIDF